MKSIFEFFYFAKIGRKRFNIMQLFLLVLKILTILKHVHTERFENTFNVVYRC